MSSRQPIRLWSGFTHELWPALVAGALMLLVGILGYLLGQPWLFPSLGPTAWFLAERPDQPGSRPYSVIVGHFIGLLAGFVSVALFHGASAPPVLSSHELTLLRILSTAFALFLTVLVTAWLRASHPPAGATTMLVALGTFSTLSDALIVMSGVVMLALCGMGLRWMQKLFEAVRARLGG